MKEFVTKSQARSMSKYDGEAVITSLAIAEMMETSHRKLTKEMDAVISAYTPEENEKVKELRIKDEGAKRSSMMFVFNKAFPVSELFNIAEYLVDDYFASLEEREQEIKEVTEEKTVETKSKEVSGVGKISSLVISRILQVEHSMVVSVMDDMREMFNIEEGRMEGEKEEGNIVLFCGIIEAFTVIKEVVVGIETPEMKTRYLSPEDADYIFWKMVDKIETLTPTDSSARKTLRLRLEKLVLDQFKVMFLADIESSNAIEALKYIESTTLEDLI